MEERLLGSLGPTQSEGTCVSRETSLLSEGRDLFTHQVQPSRYTDGEIETRMGTRAAQSPLRVASCSHPVLWGNCAATRGGGTDTLRH